MNGDIPISFDAMTWDNVASILPSPSASVSQSAPLQQAQAPTPAPPAPAALNGSKRKQKKVRSACERCRYRRVKCDGQVPACGSCAKAGAQCIDIDSRDADRRLMRGSFEQAVARIAWLEEIIRTQLPHINLDSDDPVTLSQMEHFGGISVNASESLEVETQNTSSLNYMASNIQDNATPETGSSVTSHHQPCPARGTKRPLSDLNAGSTLQRKSIDQEARSMALELGLLSLNSNSHQTHYLGSSSGSLFTPLFLTTQKSGSGMAEADSRGGGFYRDGHGRNETLQVKSGMPSQSDILGVQRTVGALYEQLRKDFPSREECNTLLDGFFNHMHPNHPFLHRPSFKCMVDGLYECVAESTAASTATSTQYNGWPLSVQPFSYNGEEYISQGQKLIPIDVHVAAFQLLVALSIGATLQIRRQRYNHNPKVFFDSAIKLSSSVFGRISLPVLQAILLVAVHSLIDPDGCDVWTLTHVAMAHAVDLGIHREVGGLGLFSPAAIEIRRRVFFCVYSLDRSISTIQGRPLGLGDDTFDVHLPDMSESQIQLAISGTSSDKYDDISTMAYSIQVFKMAQLVSRIKSAFYRLPVHNDASDISKDHTNIQNQLHTDLDHWLAESTAAIVETIREDQRFRLNTKLQIQYHAAMCILHQPSQAITHPNEDSLGICYKSATQRLHLYEALYDSGALCHSWRTVQDTFLASATIMYCVSISPAVRRSVSISSLSRDFRSCSSMLSVGGEWWPTTRKAKYGLERLLNKILEMLAETSYSDGAELRVGQQPFSQDYSPNMENWQEPEVFGPNGLEQTLLSVLNHNGRLIDFFEDTDGWLNSWDAGQVTGGDFWT